MIAWVAPSCFSSLAGVVACVWGLTALSMAGLTTSVAQAAEIGGQQPTLYAIGPALEQRVRLLAQAERSAPLGDRSAVPPDYLIGPGDRLDVRVRNHPEISTTVTVRPDGRVSFPLVEDFPISGKTVGEAERELETRLSTYIRDPQVNLIVTAAVGAVSEQVRVVGGAVEPKAIPYRAGLTLLDVMVAVGGLSTFADGNSAVVIRQEGQTTRRIPVRLDDLVEGGDVTANIALAPGDVLLIPEGFFAGDWTVVPFLGVSETYTDNVNLVADDEESAFITLVTPGVSIRGDTARVSGGLDAALNGRYQTAGDDEGFSFDGDVLGTGTAEIAPDFLFLDAAASISQEVLDSEDAQSGIAAVDTNRETVQVYTASPYIRNRLGRFATAETRYAFGQVLTQDGDDSTINSGLFTLSSGPDFSRLLWALNGIVSHVNRTEDDDIFRAEADLGLEYVLVRSFSLIGGGGYEKFDDGEEANEIDGPTWRGGFRWRPSTRLDLLATYGRRDGEDSFAGDFRYDITPRTILTASYAETLETPQERLVGNLAFIGIDEETGQFVDTRTGGSFNPVPNPFGLDGETTRVKQFNAGLNSVLGRNTFGIGAIVANEKVEVTGEEEDVIQINAAYIRQLSQRLALNIAGFYENTQFDEDDREDDDYFIGGGLSYALLTNLTGTVFYSFRLRESNEAEEDFTENAITVGLVATF